MVSLFYSYPLELDSVKVIQYCFLVWISLFLRRLWRLRRYEWNLSIIVTGWISFIFVYLRFRFFRFWCCFWRLLACEENIIARFKDSCSLISVSMTAWGWEYPYIILKDCYFCTFDIGPGSCVGFCTLTLVLEGAWVPGRLHGRILKGFSPVLSSAREIWGKMKKVRKNIMLVEMSTGGYFWWCAGVK